MEIRAQSFDRIEGIRAQSFDRIEGIRAQSFDRIEGIRAQILIEGIRAHGCEPACRTRDWKADAYLAAMLDFVRLQIHGHQRHPRYFLHQAARERWGGQTKGWLWGKDAEGLGW